jgi:hypothetical protein
MWVSSLEEMENGVRILVDLLGFGGDGGEWRGTLGLYF